MPRGPTSRHVACRVGTQLVVHTFRCADSVLVWDPETRALREQQTSGPAPSSRGLHVAAAADEHTMIVFGGAAKDGSMCNDAFALDTRTWQWRTLATEGAKNDKTRGGIGELLTKLFGGGRDGGDSTRPTPRAGACAASLPGGERGIVVACGAEAGLTGLVPRADVWALVLDDGESADGTWTRLMADDAPNAPAPRNAATLTPLGDGETLLLHGGWHPFVRTFGDSFILRIHA